MSIKAMVYYLDHSKQTGNDKLALVILADYANDSGECYPGHKRIAYRLNMTVSGTRKLLYKLRDEKEIEIVNAKGIGTKNGNTNLYRLTRYRQSIGYPPRDRVSQAWDTPGCPAEDTPPQESRVSQAGDTDPSVLNRQVEPSGSQASPACPSAKDSTPTTHVSGSEGRSAESFVQETLLEDLVTKEDHGWTPEDPPGSPRGMPTAHQEMFGAICSVVGWDYKTLDKSSKGQVAQTMGVLKKAGYTVAEIERWFAEVWQKDWRWTQKGERPTIKQLRQEIGKVKDLPEEGKLWGFQGGAQWG